MYEITSAKVISAFYITKENNEVNISCSPVIAITGEDIISPSSIYDSYLKTKCITYKLKMTKEKVSLTLREQQKKGSANRKARERTG